VSPAAAPRPGAVRRGRRRAVPRSASSFVSPRAGAGAACSPRKSVPADVRVIGPPSRSARGPVRKTTRPPAGRVSRTAVPPHQPPDPGAAPVAPALSSLAGMLQGAARRPAGAGLCRGRRPPRRSAGLLARLARRPGRPAQRHRAGKPASLTRRRRHSGHRRVHVRLTTAGCASRCCSRWEQFLGVRPEVLDELRDAAYPPGCTSPTAPTGSAASPSPAAHVPAALRFISRVPLSGAGEREQGGLTLHDLK